MNEMYWAIVSNLSLFVNTAVTGYCFYKFVTPSLSNKNYAKITGLAYVCTMLMLYYVPYVFYNIAAYGIGVMVSTVLLMMFDNRNFNKKLFLGITFGALRWITSGISTIVYALSTNTVFSIPATFGNDRLQFVMFVLLLVMDTVISFGLLDFAIRIIRCVYKNYDENISFKELLLLASPSIMAMSAYLTKTYYAGIVNIEFSLKSSIIDFLNYSISYLSILAVLYFYQSIKDMESEKNSKKLLAMQLEDIKSYINVAEQHYDDIRRFKHDVKNHLVILESLYKAKENKEADLYMKELAQRLDETNYMIKTGNPITDVILNEKFKQAEYSRIDFQCDFLFPVDTGINAFDISIILCNALDNAFTAVKEAGKPYIKMKSYVKNNAYILEIENSCKENVIFCECDKPYGKANTFDIHGLGIGNIKEVAKKYHGDIDIECGNGRFLLWVMLMMK